jgi:hypothetical protein
MVTSLAGMSSPEYRRFISCTRGLYEAVVVAFYDQDRLRRNDGQNALESFKFFLNPIQEIVKRDFPNVEFRILTGGTLLRLPDGTALNVQNVQPTLGFVLSAQGRKRGC